VLERGNLALDDFLTFAQSHLRDHETSMLQHCRRGTELEIHRIIEIVITLGEMEGVGVPVPQLSSVHREIQVRLQAPK
jgi:ketopantoate reductase